MFVTPKQMQALERLTDESGVSYAEMMERAGTALAAAVRKHAPRAKTVALLAGTGNNGGDCYVAAHVLHAAGWKVQVIAPFGPPKTEIALAAAERAKADGIAIRETPNRSTTTAKVLVDGLFGTGFHGDLPEAAIPLLAPREGQLHVAADIPSGGNAATGHVAEGTFAADVTVTFGMEKIGMAQYPLREYCGVIETADIGIPKEAYEKLSFPPIKTCKAERAAATLPDWKPDDHKNCHGHLLVVAGSVRMRGACVLAVEAAMRSGVGLQTAATAEAALQAICMRVPEVMCMPLETDEWGFLLNEENHTMLRASLWRKAGLCIGCGMGVTENTRNLTKFLLEESECPVVIDADGLNCLKDHIEWIPRGRTVLTPHPGEAARLLGVTTAEIQADRPAAARRLAERTGAVVVLKGAGTIVTDGVRMAVCLMGNAGMARAGSGDVLAGITGSFLSQGLAPYEAACTAVALHAAAGDAAAAKYPHRYMLPQDLINALSEVL